MSDNNQELDLKSLCLEEKILLAQEYIAGLGLKKRVKNTFLKCNSYAPSDICRAVMKASLKFRIFCTPVNLLQDEYGFYSETTVINLDDRTQQLTCRKRTAVAEGALSQSGKKSVNPTQEFGSTDTYNARYLFQSIFAIGEDELDADNDIYFGVTMNANCINQAQKEELSAIARERGISTEQARGIVAQYGYASSREIRVSDFNAVKQSFLSFAQPQLEPAKQSEVVY